MAQKLDIAFWNYDRTRLLADGSVRIEGADVAFHSARIVPEIFEAMIRRRAYDVSELGMTYFLRTFDEEGRSPFLAIPVFPVRAFRHGAIYINRNSGIKKPQNLVGKRIGELALYGHDAGVIPKSILSDDFGVKPEQNHWIIGGIDFPIGPIDFVSHPVPAGVEVEWVGTDVDLGAMLERGEIDPLISADAPNAALVLILLVVPALGQGIPLIRAGLMRTISAVTGPARLAGKVGGRLNSSVAGSTNRRNR